MLIQVANGQRGELGKPEQTGDCRTALAADLYQLTPGILSFFAQGY
jgi:hypothetical protein